MAALTATGLGSGLDISSLVEQLVSAERAPTANRLTAREAKANAELSALGKFRSALATFKDALENLKDLDSFQGRKVTVGDEEIFTASAGSASQPGSYEVEVLALPTSQRLRSAAFPDATSAVGTGTLQISVGGAATNIVIDGTANSLNDIRNAINAAPNNPGVRASVVNAADGAYLVLSSTTTGTAGTLRVTVTGGDGGLAGLAYDPLAGTNPMTVQSAAADASLKIDGVTVTSADNAITDAIEGLTIDLKAAQPGTVLNLTVALDPAGAKTSVQGFVTAYNKLMDTVAELTRYNADTREAAPLLGDATVRGVRDQLRRTLAGSAGQGLYDSLAAIGVTTQTNGKLELNAGRLEDALEADFAAVGRLFAGTTGLATRLDDIAEATLAGNSTIATRETALKTTLKSITTQRTTLDDRMEQVRERLREQFTAMDTLVNQLKNTSSFLSRQLGS